MLFFVVCVLPGCLFWHLYSVRIVIVFVNSQKQLSEVFYKKSVLINFAKFKGKHLCWSLFFIMLQASGLQLH